MIVTWPDGTKTEVEWRETHTFTKNKDNKRPKEIALEYEEFEEIIMETDPAKCGKNEFYMNHLFNGLANDAKITLMRKQW